MSGVDNFATLISATFARGRAVRHRCGQ